MGTVFAEDLGCVRERGYNQMVGGRQLVNCLSQRPFVNPTILSHPSFRLKVKRTEAGAFKVSAKYLVMFT